MRIDVVNRLKDAGIKPSLQRIAILEYLLNNPIHPSVDTVYIHLAHEIQTLSRTTVYSTLKLMADAGVIKAITIDEKNIRYDGFIHEHAHFMCKGCGEIHDLEIENFSAIKVPDKKGLTIMEGTIYFRGLCQKCRT